MAKTKKKNRKKMGNPLKTLYSNSIGAVIAELKQVTWTKPSELLGLVVFIILVCGLVAVAMAGLDNFFGEVVTRLLKL